MCSTGQPNSDGREELCLKVTKNDDDSSSLKSGTDCAQLSTSITMSENKSPTLVYRRKPLRRPISTTQPPDCIEPNDGSSSAICPEATSVVARELLVSASEHASDAIPSYNGYLTREEASSEDALKIDGERVSNACSADDNCSTSKSSLELGSASLKTDTVDGGNSSSRESIAISARDACISVLRSHGLLDKVLDRLPQQRGSFEGYGAISENCYCSMECKVCERTESTSNMLVCDNCEDAFHVSCYNRHMMLLPKGDWLCCSCLEKKHKILEDKSTGNTSNEIDRNQQSTSEGKFGYLEFLFRDTEPHMSNVRIGDEFQAVVPNWRGPNYEESDLDGDPLEISDLDGDPLEKTPNNIDKKEQDCIKPLNLGSIGNWIQCQAVVDGIGEDVDGTVCGKWRRAPLFEVQTDDWECYRCILWDPVRADCAVPQEVSTEEVMRQLKYMETLRPQLAAKKRKLDLSAADETHIEIHRTA